uniref:Membrane glycoprotein E51 n=1 Tax=Elephant endotheliotropic herpesvirus 1A TaxID=759753 RepID=A0A866VUI9_ELHV1|nr:membrane glycoprotein E51 [Elephant endotheliotropic herpesvirus 1A]
MMGGGRNHQYTLYLLGTFSVFTLCVQLDLCKSGTKSLETPTFSTFNNHINITLKTKTVEFYVLVRNDSVISTTSKNDPNVNINETHFTLVTSCAMGTGSYLLQIITKSAGTTCQYFNVTTCPCYGTSMHLAQSSRSDCEYAMFTITSFVMLTFT